VAIDFSWVLIDLEVVIPLGVEKAFHNPVVPVLNRRFSGKFNASEGYKTGSGSSRTLGSDFSPVFVAGACLVPRAWNEMRWRIA